MADAAYFCDAASEAVDLKDDACRCACDTTSRSRSPQSLYRRLRTRTGRMPRRWLTDRCDGRSRYGGESRPPNRACWPPVLLKWFPDLLEQNCLCENVGRFGCVDHTNSRRRRALLGTCLVANVVGLTFLVLASFAIAEQSFGLLWTFSFTRVWLELVQGPEDYYETPSFFAVGLRAAAWRETVAGNQDAVIPFTNFCTLADRPTPYSTSGGATFMTLFVDSLSVGVSDGCESCQDISKRIVPSLFLSMLGYIPNFTTDILRMYENYDVNCQKFFASVFSWISLSTAIYTWVNYHRNCFAYLDPTPIYLSEDLEPIYDNLEEDAFLVVRFRYRAGFGEVCLALASLLKIVDIACNIVLPTPSITRDHAEQAEYEWRYGPQQQHVGNDGDSTTRNTTAPNACAVATSNGATVPGCDS